MESSILRETRLVVKLKNLIKLSSQKKIRNYSHSFKAQLHNWIRCNNTKIKMKTVEHRIVLIDAQINVKFLQNNQVGVISEMYHRLQY